MQEYIYFSMYMTRGVIFGTGIAEIIEKQNDELQKIYETPIIRKLGLEAKFPRKVLYIR